MKADCGHEDCGEGSHAFLYGIPKIGQPCSCGQYRWFVEHSLWKRLKFALWSFHVQLYLALHPTRFDE